MKPATTSLLISLSVAVITLAAAEYAFRSSGLHDRMVKEKRYTALPEHFEALEEDPDVIFIGDSRTIHGVKPSVIEAALADALGERVTAFNLGLPGAPPITHLAWSGYVLARRERPRLVVIYLSEYMFSSLIEPTMSRESIPSLYRWRDAPAAWSAGMPAEDAFAILNVNLSHALRFRRQLLALIFDNRETKAPYALSPKGYATAGRVRASEQARRARGRARGYREELSPPAELNEEQLGYLEASLRRFHEAGVPVLLLTSPSSRPLWANHDLELVEASHARVKKIARSFDAPFIRYRDTTPLADMYFSDGDHLNPEGAQRYSTWLAYDVIAPALEPGYVPPSRWTPRAPSEEGCEVLFDFEDRVIEGWTVSGDAFSPLAVTGGTGNQRPVEAGRGLQLLNSHHPQHGDRAVGEARSPTFTISGGRLSLWVGGGDVKGVGVELWVEGERRRAAKGGRSERLRRVEWDTRDLDGVRARLRLFDASKGSWGHIMLDHVEQCGPLSESK